MGENTKPRFVSPELVRTAADCILEGFRWVATPQGVEYWDEVYRNLRDIAEGRGRD